jgi:hypothetical protein
MAHHSLSYFFHPLAQAFFVNRMDAAFSVDFPASYHCHQDIPA